MPTQPADAAPGIPSRLRTRLRLRISPVAGLAALAGFALTIALGIWQMHRADGKIALQQRIVAALEAPAQPLSADGDAASLVWQRMRARGTWLPADVVYLDNRPNEGRAGFYVLMALKLKGSGKVVVVDRGWMPRDPANRTRIAPYDTPSGEVDVEGLMLADEPRLLELGQSAAGKTGGIWQNFNFDAFAAASGQLLLPAILRQESGQEDGLARNWPDRGQVLQGQIDRHHGYAFQWFALSALIVALTLFYGFRNARKHSRNAAS